MSAFIKANAVLPSDFSLTKVPSMVAGWYRPRHDLIWGELRRLGKEMVEPEPAPVAQPKPRRQLRFAV